jgi:hypothetical protein
LIIYPYLIPPLIFTSLIKVLSLLFTPSQSLFSLSSRYMILTSALAMSAATRPLHRAK